MKASPDGSVNDGFDHFIFVSSKSSSNSNNVNNNNFNSNINSNKPFPSNNQYSSANFNHSNSNSNTNGQDNSFQNNGSSNSNIQQMRNMPDTNYNNNSITKEQALGGLEFDRIYARLCREKMKHSPTDDTMNNLNNMNNRNNGNMQHHGTNIENANPQGIQQYNPRAGIVANIEVQKIIPGLILGESTSIVQNFGNSSSSQNNKNSNYGNNGHSSNNRHAHFKDTLAEDSVQTHLNPPRAINQSVNSSINASMISNHSNINIPSASPATDADSNFVFDSDNVYKSSSIVSNSNVTSAMDTQLPVGNGIFKFHQFIVLMLNFFTIYILIEF